MTIIPVSGGAFAAYEVVVGRGLLAEAGARIAPLAKGRTVIVTDATVAALHGPAANATQEESAATKHALIIVETSRTCSSCAWV